MTMQKNKSNFRSSLVDFLKNSGYKYRYYGLLFLLVLPAVLCLLFIYRYGVNVVFWDEWELVPLIDKLQIGNISWADLFAQHNEHRLFFPRIVMLLISRLTHFNTCAGMYFSWFLLCLICTFLFYIYTRRQGYKAMSLLKFTPVVWLFFSLHQWENLLWGFQIQFYMVVLFFLLSTYFLFKAKTSIINLMVALVCGLICSFSLANGLLVWPVGLAVLVYYWWRKESPGGISLKTIVVWSIATIGVFAIYLAGYIKPIWHPGLFDFLYHPVSAVAYFIIFLGNPLAADGYTAAAAGLVVIMLYLVIGVFALKAKKSEQPTQPLYLGLLLLTLGSGILLVVGRSGFGIDQAFSSRYVTLATLGIVALYLTIISVKIEPAKIRQFSFCVIMVLIFVGMIAGDFSAFYKDGVNLKTSRTEAAYYLLTYEYQTDRALTSLYPDPGLLRSYAAILEKNNLNVFYNRLKIKDLPLISGSTAYSLDTLDDREIKADQTVVIDSQSEDSLIITGWAIDQLAGQAAGGVFVSIDGQTDIQAMYGLDSSKVANAHHNKQYRNSGFKASFAKSILTKGQHGLSLKIVTHDQKSYYQTGQVTVLEVK
jgi:hypothetical protein